MRLVDWISTRQTETVHNSLAYATCKICKPVKSERTTDRQSGQFFKMEEDAMNNKMMERLNSEIDFRLTGDDKIKIVKPFENQHAPSVTDEYAAYDGISDYEERRERKTRSRDRKDRKDTRFRKTRVGPKRQLGTRRDLY